MSSGSGQGPSKPAKNGGKVEKQLAKEKKKRRKKLHRVLKTHPEFEMTFDMQIGIRHVLGMDGGGVKNDSRDGPIVLQDFEESVKLKFPREGSTVPPFTPPHNSRDFTFKAYAPKIFQRIRERFGISTIQFITSVCGNFEYLSFKTNSKSGQFFFYSYDKRYMLKTITKRECKLLSKILPSYYQHVMDNPNTLLCRFYGMHRVKPAGKVMSFHFLIMESVFNTDLEVQQIFDLKGSTVNRYAKRGESVYKDIDFIDNNFRFRLPMSVATKLKNSIQTDAAFLKEAGLMDYSLLVGIHYLDGRPKKIEYKQDRIRRLKEKEMKQADNAPIGVPKKYNVISQPKKENVQMSQELDAKFVGNSQKNLKNSNAASAEHLSGINLQDIKPNAANSHQLSSKNTSAKNISLKKVSNSGATKDDKKNKDNEAKTTMKSVKGVLPAHHGGLRSVSLNGPGNEIYYVGIIDILTGYGFRKGLEHRVTSMIKDGNLISCVHPSVYGNRFEDFLIQRIEGVEGPEDPGSSMYMPAGSDPQRRHSALASNHEREIKEENLKNDNMRAQGEDAPTQSTGEKEEDKEEKKEPVSTNKASKDN